MRGVFGGIVSGGMVSVLALSVVSVVSEQPAGVTPPSAPLVDAPVVDDAPDPAAGAENGGVSTPVGSLSIDEPQAPALPEAEAALAEPESPVAVDVEQSAPNADTDPLDEPAVVSIEGTLAAPETSQTGNLQADAIDPVLPNPQSIAPQVPESEANLTVSTTPATPVIVIEPEAESDAVEADDTEQDVITENTTGSVLIEGTEDEETFVINLGVDAPEPDTSPEDTPDAAPADSDDSADQQAVASQTAVEPENIDATPFAEESDTGLETPATPRFQLQGSENTLLSDRGTGVTIRRPGVDDAGDSDSNETADAAAPEAGNALVDYAAAVEDTGDSPLMSIVLIDDGTMSAAAAALAGLPFDVTIALDPAMDGAASAMDRYRADGFEVGVLAKVPEGAVPSDVEIAFESVFSTLPETIAVVDLGEAGLQADREVTAQAMEILAAQGRGYITVSQGLNTASRAAELAGVPSGEVYRELDGDDQDARVIRRFVEQAAFRARQESGVILVGRVRPDTISALILWGTANQGDQVAIVPLSAVLNANN